MAEVPGNEDVTVRMKVTLDEDDIREQTTRAEEKVNKKEKSKTSAGEKTKESRTFFEGMSQSVSKGLTDWMGRSGIGRRIVGVIKGPTGGAAAAGGGMLAGAAGGALAGAAAVALVAAGWQLVKRLREAADVLSKFNPAINRATRQYEIAVRGISIQMSRILEPALVSLTDASRELLVTLAQVLKPVLMGLAVLIKAWTVRLRSVLGIIRTVSNAINDMGRVVARFIATVLEWISKFAPPEVAEDLKGAAGWLKRAAESLGSRDPVQDALRLNRSFIDQMSQVGEGSGSEGSGGVFSTPGRVPVSAPRINIPEFKQKVNLTMNMRLMHEESVQKAIEQVRSVLSHSIRRVKNDQIMLAGMLESRTSVDLL